MADVIHELTTPGAAAASAADAVPAAVPDIAAIEAQVEANVQRTLDTFDAWKVTMPFRAKEAKDACSKEKHKCDLSAETTKDMCVGCTLYKRLVHERGIFPVGGRSDVVDYLATGVAAPLIFAFIQNGDWLSPMAGLRGRWFVRHPITHTTRAASALSPEVQVAVKRNIVRIFNGDELLTTLGIPLALHESVFKRLRDFWHTAEEGTIYSLDDLLDQLGPITQIAQTYARLGLEDTPVADLVRGTARIQEMLAK